jgi:hypothetical protein
MRLATAALLLAPQVPLLFMGEEIGAKTPFLFFTDFHGELADAVREGRRKEFAAFPKFSSDEARAAIPDPNSESTFAACKIAWDAADAQWLAAFTALLKLRFAHIVPRLAGEHRGSRFEALPPGGISVDWTLGDASVLRMRANFSAHSRAGPEAGRGRDASHRGSMQRGGGPRAVERRLVPGAGAMNARLEKLAELCGVERGYEDVFRKWQETPEQAIRSVLACIGIKAETASDIEASIAEIERERRRRVVPPVSVRRAGTLRDGVLIHLPEGSLARTLAWRIVEEEGGVREERLEPLNLQGAGEFDVGERRMHAFQLPLPDDLPEGYHRLSILEGGAGIGEGVLVVAPDACYLPPAIAAGARIWGASVQLYGITSSRNAGIGDFTDLRAAVEAWSERGGGIVGTNPLHSLSLRDPGTASPYSPGSRLFLNPIYIDVEAVEDFRELAERDAAFARQWHAQCEKLRATPEVDYPAVARAKREMLGKLYASFARRHVAKATRRARAFAQFRAMRGQALRRHAIHEALEEFHGKRWREWPEEHRDPASRKCASSPTSMPTRSRSTSTCNGRRTSSSPMRRRARARPAWRWASTRTWRSPSRATARGMGEPEPLCIGRERRRTARRVQHEGTGLGAAAAVSGAHARFRIRPVHRDAAREHGARGRASHRPRDGARPPLLDPARRDTRRRRLRALRGGRPPGHRGAREPPPSLPRDRRGSRHRGRLVPGEARRGARAVVPPALFRARERRLQGAGVVSARRAGVVVHARPARRSRAGGRTRTCARAHRSGS